MAEAHGLDDRQVAALTANGFAGAFHPGRAKAALERAVGRLDDPPGPGPRPDRYDGRLHAVRPGLRGRPLPGVRAATGGRPGPVRPGQRPLAGPPPRRRQRPAARPPLRPHLPARGQPRRDGPARGAGGAGPVLAPDPQRHAGPRTARPHPAAPAGGQGVHPPDGRAAPRPGPGPGRPAGRRAGRRRRGRPGRRAGRAAVGGRDQRPAGRARGRPAAAAALVGPDLRHVRGRPGPGGGPGRLPGGHRVLRVPARAVAGSAGPARPTT